MTVEEYVQNLSVSEAEKHRYSKDITAMQCILAQHDRIFPEESDYQEFRQSATDKNPKTTEDRIRRIKKYFDTLQKGEIQMTMSELEEKNAVISEKTEENNPEALPPVEANKKAGRPKSTNRTAKFTLYMTDELMKKINLLADLDETTSTELMNHVLEDYCDNTRADDMNFLYELERRKQERRQGVMKR